MNDWLPCLPQKVSAIPIKELNPELNTQKDSICTKLLWLCVQNNTLLFAYFHIVICVSLDFF